MSFRSANKTIKEAQQQMANNFGYREEVIWDVLSSDDADVLRKKIAQIIPDQTKGQDIIQEMRRDIFNSVWKQRKYSNNLSVTYIFYVMVTEDNIYDAEYSTKFSYHPVFRCRKCTDNSDTSNCCMIYVDELGRIYENWKSYINENVLPAGTMVTPRRGIYNFNRRGEVILDSYCTPNGEPEAKVMKRIQTGSAVVGLGAAFVPLAALALPVAAPIMAAAGTIGLGVGALTAVTSFLHLKDRGRHGQSISLGNREARSCYIGIVGGSAGVAAAGATRVMTSMASAGRATKKMETLINGINISSLAISGSGVVNGAIDLLFKSNDNDEISTLEYLQFSASLILFTNSLYNFQLASRIANNARNNSIKSYRDGLSNRNRKMFDKLSKETMRIRGGTQGKMDILRSVNKIGDRQYLNDLYKINKSLNQQKVRPAFGDGSSGKNIVLNNQIPVETAELRQSVQHQQGPKILAQVTEPIPSSHKSDKYTIQTPKAVKLFYANTNEACNLDIAANEDNWQTSMNELSVRLKNGAVLVLDFLKKSFFNKISDLKNFEDVVESMFENLREDVAKLLMRLAQRIIQEFCQEIERHIKILITTESILYEILKWVLRQTADLTYQYVSEKSENIIKAVVTHFNRLSSIDHQGNHSLCEVCGGIKVISQL